MEVEKGDERVSNWEWDLNSRQIDCEHHTLIVYNLFYVRLIFLLDAANDVHSSMEVYLKLCDIAERNAISLADNMSAFTTDVAFPSSEKYL